MLFLDRTKPLSTQQNPACMVITSTAQMRIQNVFSMSALIVIVTDFLWVVSGQDLGYSSLKAGFLFSEPLPGKLSALR